MLIGHDAVATHAATAELYARCRWNGVTPRSPHDCLIAVTAVEHVVALLHDDEDYRRLAEVERRLVLLPLG